MRNLNWKQIFRCFVCLVLVCALLVNISPIKARAEAITGAAVVSVVGVAIPVSAVVVPLLCILGIGYATNDDFRDLVNNGAIAIAGYVRDGFVDLIRTVDADGKVTFLVEGGLIEALRSWLFDSETVTTQGIVINPDVELPTEALSVAAAAPYSFFSYTLTVSGAYAGSMGYVLVYSFESPIKVTYGDSDGNGYTIGCQDKTATIWSYSKNFGWRSFTGTAIGQNTSKRLVDSAYLGTADPLTFTTTLDLELGVLPTSAIDGTSAREWAPEYANRGLYVVPGSGTGTNEGQDGKWFWPIALGLIAGDLGAMSQAEHWLADTPDEFSEYEEKTEYEVTPAPEFDGYPSIEISPVRDPDVDPGGGSDATEPEDPDSTSPTSPDQGDPGTGDGSDFPDLGGDEFPGSNPGSGTNPGTGTDPGTDPDPDPDPGTSTDPDSGSSSWAPSGTMGNFALDLKNYFPFCIPYDLYAFFTCLNAEPVAPVIDWIIPMPGGGSYPMQIDLSVFDSVAQTLRRLQLLLFCVGLAFKTRDLIKG